MIDPQPLEGHSRPTTEEVPGHRFDATGVFSVVDALTTEVPLQIDLNGESFSVTMRTPGDDRALVRGLLFTEGIVTADATGWQYLPRKNESMDPDDAATASERATVIDVRIPEVFICRQFYDRRSLVSSSSCGLCGIKEWGDPDPEAKPIESTVQLPFANLVRAMEAMRESQQAFDRSGGCHGAAAFDATGARVAVAEDIGRHNAVDKVIGQLLEDGRIADAVLVTVSGRISFEIVSKIYRAGIPVLAAVSAPSTLAVDMGNRLGVSVAGFCRDGRATVYSHADRLVATEVAR